MGFTSITTGRISGRRSVFIPTEKQGINPPPFVSLSGL